MPDYIEHAVFDRQCFGCFVGWRVEVQEVRSEPGIVIHRVEWTINKSY